MSFFESTAASTKEQRAKALHLEMARAHFGAAARHGAATKHGLRGMVGLYHANAASHAPGTHPRTISAARGKAREMVSKHNDAMVSRHGLRGDAARAKVGNSHLERGVYHAHKVGISEDSARGLPSTPGGKWHV